jgi:hypothetical protein
MELVEESFVPTAAALDREGEKRQKTAVLVGIQRKKTGVARRDANEACRPTAFVIQAASSTALCFSRPYAEGDCRRRRVARRLGFLCDD